MSDWRKCISIAITVQCPLLIAISINHFNTNRLRFHVISYWINFWIISLIAVKHIQTVSIKVGGTRWNLQEFLKRRGTKTITTNCEDSEILSEEFQENLKRSSMNTN